MLKCSNKKRKISPNFNENLPYSHLIFQLKGLPFLPTIGFMEAAPSCKGLRWWLKAVKSPLLQMEVWSLHLGGVRWKILSSTNLKERILYFFGGGSKRCENFLGELYHHSIGISKIRRKHKKEAKFESIFKIKTSSKHEFVSFWEMRTPFGLGPSLLQWTSVKTQGPKVTQKLMVDRIPNSIRFFLVVFCLFKKFQKCHPNLNIQSLMCRGIFFCSPDTWHPKNQVKLEIWGFRLAVRTHVRHIRDLRVPYVMSSARWCLFASSSGNHETGFENAMSSFCVYMHDFIYCHLVCTPI